MLRIGSPSRPGARVPGALRVGAPGRRAPWAGPPAEDSRAPAPLCRARRRLRAAQGHPRTSGDTGRARGRHRIWPKSGGARSRPPCTSRAWSCAPRRDVPPNKPMVLTVRAASLRSAARPAAHRQDVRRLDAVARPARPGATRAASRRALPEGGAPIFAGEEGAAWLVVAAPQPGAAARLRSWKRRPPRGARTSRGTGTCRPRSYALGVPIAPPAVALEWCKVGLDRWSWSAAPPPC